MLTAPTYICIWLVWLCPGLRRGVLVVQRAARPRPGVRRRRRHRGVQVRQVQLQQQEREERQAARQETRLGKQHIKKHDWVAARQETRLGKQHVKKRDWVSSTSRNTTGQAQTAHEYNYIFAENVLFVNLVCVARS